MKRTRPSVPRVSWVSALAEALSVPAGENPGAAALGPASPSETRVTALCHDFLNGEAPSAEAAEPSLAHADAPATHRTASGVF